MRQRRQACPGTEHSAPVVDRDVQTEIVPGRHACTRARLDRFGGGHRDELDVAARDQYDSLRQPRRGNIESADVEFAVELAARGERLRVEGTEIIDTVLVGWSKHIELVVAGDSADAEVDAARIFVQLLEDLLG